MKVRHNLSEAKKARSHPDSESSCSQKRSSGTVSRTKTESSTDANDFASCPDTVSNDVALLHNTDRYDDGRDESIVSPKLVKNAVLRKVVPMTAIKAVRLRVVIKASEDAQSLTLCRSRTFSRTVVNPESRQLALINVVFLVTDDELVRELLIIRLSVSHYLHVEKFTLLENNRAVIDGPDCSHNNNPSTESRFETIKQMMIACLNCRQTPEDRTDSVKPVLVDRHCVNYRTTRTDEDSFADPSLLRPIVSDQQAQIWKAVDRMEKTAAENVLPTEYQKSLSNIMHEFLHMFRTTFAVSPAAQISPLKTVFTQNLVPVKVCLRNYTQYQRKSLTELADNLISNRRAYLNPA